MLGVVVAGALAAPATVASAADGARRACPPGTTDGVITAYAEVFSRVAEATADVRAARLQDADQPAVRALYDAWLADPAGRNTSITVADVRCRSADRAVATTTLMLAGTPLAEVIPRGRAVLEDGVWKVARSTFCTRMILEDPALATAGPCRRR